MENMNPILDEEGGNLYLINGAMTKLADAGAFVKTDTGQQLSLIHIFTGIF